MKKNLVVFLIIFLITGCEFNKVPEGKKEDITLKVMYWDEANFLARYGNLFYSQYPDLNVEITSPRGIFDGTAGYYETLEGWIKEQKPDVLYFDQADLPFLVEKGLLVPLDPWIGDEFLSGYQPAVTDYLRDMGEGKLYGLSAYFNSEAVFYNKDLFERYGLSPPDDRMTWEELFLTAQKFPHIGDNGERIFGLYSHFGDNPFLFATQIGQNLGLSYIDPYNQKLTIDSEEWTRVFNLIFDCIQQGSCYDREEDLGMTNEDEDRRNRLGHFPFLLGNIAIAIAPSNYLGYIEFQDQKYPNWDLAPMPGNPRYPNASNAITVNEIFAISTNSENKEAAWNFIQYISSDDYARVMSRNLNNGLTARTDFIKDIGKNIEAFYKATEVLPSAYSGFRQLPPSFLQQFDEITQNAIDKIVNGQWTVEYSLKQIQQEGQAELNFIFKKKNS